MSRFWCSAGFGLVSDVDERVGDNVLIENLGYRVRRPNSFSTQTRPTKSACRCQRGLALVQKSSSGILAKSFIGKNQLDNPRSLLVEYHMSKFILRLCRTVVAK